MDQESNSAKLDWNNIPKQPPIEWYTGEWNGPLIELDPNDPFGHMEQLFSRGIHLTSITPPEQGWPIMAHCSICKKTVIVLSLYAAKPEKGDIWSLKGTCLDEDEHIRHNMYPQHDYPWTSRKGPFQFHPLDPLPPTLYPSWVEIKQEMPIEEAMKRWPEMFEKENDESK